MSSTSRRRDKKSNGKDMLLHSESPRNTSETRVIDASLLVRLLPFERGIRSFLSYADCAAAVRENSKQLRQPAIVDIVEYIDALGRVSGRAVDPSSMCIQTIRDVARLHSDADVAGYRVEHENERIAWVAPCACSSARLAPLVIPTSLTYRIYANSSKSVVSYVLCFYGTGYGSIVPQLITDFTPFVKVVRVEMGDVSYRLSFSASMYESAIGGFDAIVEQLTTLKTRQRSGCKHRLILSGYSLGAIQMIAFVTHWLSNAVQPMWETTFARNSHAGLGKDFTNARAYSSVCRFVNLLTQSGVAISRKCCFPHGVQRNPSYQAVHATQFSEVLVPLFGCPSITYSDELASYIDATKRRFRNVAYIPITTLNDVTSAVFANAHIYQIWSSVYILDAGAHPEGLYEISGTSLSTGTIVKFARNLEYRRLGSYSFLLSAIGYGIMSHSILTYIDHLTRLTRDDAMGRRRRRKRTFSVVQA